MVITPSICTNGSGSWQYTLLPCLSARTWHASCFRRDLLDREPESLIFLDPALLNISHGGKTCKQRSRPSPLPSTHSTLSFCDHASNSLGRVYATGQTNPRTIHAGIGKTTLYLPHAGSRPLQTLVAQANILDN